MAQIGRQLITLVRNSIGIRNHIQIMSNHILNRNLIGNMSFGQKRAYPGAYDCDGKTTMDLLNNDKDFGLMINSYSQMGFRLNNNVFVLGPMAIFPKTVLSWNVDNMHDINEESLRLVSLLEPKIDILIVGTGDAEVSPAFTKRILEFMKKYKINVEVLRTEAACSTFNFLNAESRMVAALLIPPVHLRVNEDELMRRSERADVFKVEDDDPFDNIKKLK